MPNKYEREIEEILRNLELSDSPGSGGKRSERRSSSPKKERPPRGPRFRGFSWNFSPNEWFLLSAIVAALLGGGYAYATPTHEANFITGLLAIVGMICIVCVALTNFVSPRSGSAQRARHQSVQFGNVTITPLRRGPFSNLRTRWNLFLLKLRYRKNDRPR
ncbi:hypothetical protein [Ktedonobacter racemifer]|uniref:Uncharacterized protein n=1 Tax=Ktedonobacter racemifer DSM 44963 TaxID=485913 RepID=D6TK96_KTERA|nr:hypothetical protein [Ktedonobacter racemifer]EFH86196.1 hypothetical protein Krac_7485 [Ktedonobacter racemifer DSM 44963]